MQPQPLPQQNLKPTQPNPLSALAQGQLILPGVLKRLAAGQFVPQRKHESFYMGAKETSQPETGESERRDHISPLAVAKRCLRYEPDVFRLRHHHLLEVAYALNDPNRKLVMLAGAAASGKTAFCRALLELIGGAGQQVLWYNVQAHDEARDVMQYLAHLANYLTTVSATASPAPSEAKPPEQAALASNTATFNDAHASEAHLWQALQHLAQQLEQLRHLPLLLVLDNMQHLVDERQHFRSRWLREVLNTFLNAPNVKIILVGSRLPYADLQAAWECVLDYTLPELSYEQFLSLMQGERRAAEEAGAHTANAHTENVDPALRSLIDASLLQVLYKASCGQLGLTRMLAYYARYTSVNLNSFASFYQQQASRTASPQQSYKLLLAFLQPRLSWEEKGWLGLLACIRSTWPLTALQNLGQKLYPSFIEEERQLKAQLAPKSLIKPWLRTDLPPQQVLTYLQALEQEKASEKVKPKASKQPIKLGLELWVEGIAALQLAWQAQTPEQSKTQQEPEQQRLHRALEGVYQAQLEAADPWLNPNHAAEERRYHNALALSSQAEPLLGQGVFLSPFNKPFSPALGEVFHTALPPAASFAQAEKATPKSQTVPAQTQQNFDSFYRDALQESHRWGWQPELRPFRL
jgi:hypothetical protein